MRNVAIGCFGLTAQGQVWLSAWVKELEWTPRYTSGDWHGSDKTVLSGSQVGCNRLRR